MTLSPGVVSFSFAACLVACLVLAPGHLADSGDQTSVDKLPTTLDAPIADPAQANALIRRQPGFFVPNLGQWNHAASFVHRSGPMTLFLEDRGWVIDLVECPIKPRTEPHTLHRAILDDCGADQKTRGVALRMTFEGDGHVPEIVGEQELPGHHNYFLGSDENRWRTDVPLYRSVRYEKLYPGIDLRLREAKGVPEYDLLLQAGADLSRVTVHVEGAQGMSIAKDGSLVIETALGPMTQSVPETWELDHVGRKREVVCNFTLLGGDRFGFTAPGWDGDTSLTIDPGLLWSTFLGRSAADYAFAISVDARGAVTVAGFTGSANFPTTSGAYDATYNDNGGLRGADVFVSRLDPSKTGTAQLVYSTFLGGKSYDFASALSVDASGVVTVVGTTSSANWPTTTGAYDRTFNGLADAFVSRLDPSRTGTAQLVYSTYLGGQYVDNATALSVDANGVVWLTGLTDSIDFPTTRGAYDTIANGGYDAFVSRLLLAPVGRFGLVYSTFLGSSSQDPAYRISVDAGGVVTVAGHTQSLGFPTTRGAYNTTHNSRWRWNGWGWVLPPDGFVSRLDTSKNGTAQLVYSTFLGGSSKDYVRALSVDPSGVVTVAGYTLSANLPTTTGAYDTTYNGDWDAFVIRLTPAAIGRAGLRYATYLGTSSEEYAYALAVDARGIVTVAGYCISPDFPTTPGAYDTIYNGGGDVFVSRLDTSKSRSAQLVYSTFLGGHGHETPTAISADASGVVSVAGWTRTPGFPTTTGAYDRTYNGGTNFGGDVFVSRLDLGVPLYGDVHEISIRTGGTQQLTVNAGEADVSRLYWIFGSITGTKPGVNLSGVHLSLNPDLYTNVAMGAVNTTVFTKFRGILGSSGLATASFILPANLPLPSGFTFHHAYLVYDASGRIYMASNAVPLRLK